MKQIARLGTPERPYWHWSCDRCGFDDNRNTDMACKECGRLIQCETAGGHEWSPGHQHCDGGCGTDRETLKIDQEHRREDY
jgi:hypothetical protein